MNRFSEVLITKMSGTGNTFGLIDARNDSVWIKEEPSLKISRSDFARIVCDRVTGLSIDGLLFLQSGSEGFDFDWDFYNSDGSTAEMCGNAARCAARFCHEVFASGMNVFKFKTGAGLVFAQILRDNKIRIRMPEAKLLHDVIELKTSNGSVETFSLANTGVPHLVKNIVNMSETITLKDLAKEVRSHSDLQPSGANVTFYFESSAGKINAITYERGVEDYTLACGTGAVAAALVYSKDNSHKQVEVQMPGGLLQIVFVEGDSHPLMTGDALFVGEFKYSLEVIR
ncbi:MAG: diaminopimelate epimerase [Pseudobdellovibrionaceae bacterium]